MFITTMFPCRALVSLLLCLLMLSTTSCETLDALTESTKEKMLENKEALIGSLAGGTAGATIGGLAGKKKGVFAPLSGSFCGPVLPNAVSEAAFLVFSPA